ncbi:nickel pincer cofactor biosynthesis protein LarC [Dactylosporangium sp. CA-092794]|uniref:nickel pincer cofactor biosynthesis protein LarC n=1 Tax=Dactylosporangium sp. CA-092794 TaxID=3239929 RepID=UPI003D8C2B0E
MIVWLNPVGGASGDMLLSALLSLGAPAGAVRDAVASTGLRGWELEVTTRDAGSILATGVRVRTVDTATARSAREVLDLVAAARPEPVARLAVRAVSAIAAAEAGLHGVGLDELHLHELGGHDTIVDIVGVAAALHALDVTEIVSAPLPLGAGLVDSRHGPLPVPAPATLRLLTGMAVTGAPVQAETVTPTAAALLHAAEVRFAPMPPMVVRASGWGAGTRTLPDRPNVLGAVLGEPIGRTEGGLSPMTLIETTVDDVTGEVLAYTVQVLLGLGAADVWIVPAIGKKGRPAQVVCVLAPDDLVGALEGRLLAETGSLGARRTRVERHALPRSAGAVPVAGTAVDVKRGPHRAKPEYERLAELARATGRPLRELAALAEAAAAEERETGG